MAAEHKTKLSKNLLHMKFMQRVLDSETKKQLEEEEKKIINEEHWYLDLPELKGKESFIIEEQSFLLCEDLLYGRMSFRGFDPEIEKLMLQMNSKNKAEEQEEDGTVELDVSDEEMARRYETLCGTKWLPICSGVIQRVLFHSGPQYIMGRPACLQRGDLACSLPLRTLVGGGQASEI
ncbi:M-phase phosphoprotein 6 [Heterocephalus glaber]|uniref:M-phase phosphoprotein 6 n=1 Tax=Heterocephalus glaber TaxID=10181 RepID=G5BDL6_HETGA|nr:M-phase phosphoprotein 6 [Heterocephalus glaber]